MMLAEYKICVSFWSIFTVRPFNFRLVSILLHLFAFLFLLCGFITCVLLLRCVWSSFRSIWSSLTQIKLKSVNRQSRLTEVKEHSGCVCSQILPSNTPRKQQPAGCASCSLAGGENHSDPLLCQRQTHHSTSIQFLSLLRAKSCCQNATLTEVCFPKAAVSAYRFFPANFLISSYGDKPNFYKVLDAFIWNTYICT